MVSFSSFSLEGLPWISLMSDWPTPKHQHFQSEERRNSEEKKSSLNLHLPGLWYRSIHKYINLTCWSWCLTSEFAICNVIGYILAFGLTGAKCWLLCMLHCVNHVEISFTVRKQQHLQADNSGKNKRLNKLKERINAFLKAVKSKTRTCPPNKYKDLNSHNKHVLCLRSREGCFPFCGS